MIKIAIVAIIVLVVISAVVAMFIVAVHMVPEEFDEYPQDDVAEIKSKGSHNGQAEENFTR